MKNYITSEGKKIFGDSIILGLDVYYNVMMGNFSFTKEEFIKNIDKIEEFIKINNDYFIMYENYDNDGEWFLTSIIE